MTTYQVNEIFSSIQGEGKFAGLPSTFIRLQGCTVGCHWCDTKYTWGAGGTKMSVEDIIKKVIFKNVVITGGEPTLYNLDPLIKELWGRHIQLETSGQNNLKGHCAPNWITWSPKRQLDFRCALEHPFPVDEIKWVVDQQLVMSEVLACKVPARIITFMPEGFPPDNDTRCKSYAMLMEFMRHRPDDKAMYSDRLQCILEVK